MAPVTVRVVRRRNPHRAARASGQGPDLQRLERVLEPVIKAMDMDLEGIRVTAAGRRRLLRVVVDADGGVSLDDISRASRELSLKLDAATEMGELPYTLEVSSPGVDRPLTQRQALATRDRTPRYRAPACWRPVRP